MNTQSHTPTTAQAVDALRHGQVIGMPTETVYGLAADARNDQALTKIFALKGRPQDHPLIVHIDSVAALDRWAINIPSAAYTLAKYFWPGPMTLILKRRPEVSDLVTGGQDTIGLRIPAHPVAQELLHAFADGLAAPSANRFGRISPTRAAHVRAEFSEGELPIILDGGDCRIGIESTIIDVSTGAPRILRPGHISQADVDHVISNGSIACDSTKISAPRVSGSHSSHYAPRTPTELLVRPALLARMQQLQSQKQQVATLLRGSTAPNAHGIVLSDDPQAYAHDLYAALRTLDDYATTRILIEAPPENAEWEAVADRLKRASA